VGKTGSFTNIMEAWFK